jgi:cytochrome b pre-mRNA-processing protein 3
MLMKLRLFHRAPPADTVASLYGAIVAQARLPAFYGRGRVPDTVNGRFEMVLLHTALLLTRLDGEAMVDRKLGQAVFDAFCSDMDANMREMGVGDMAVPRKMRAIGEAFYGRKQAYEAALAAADPALLPATLARNVHGCADAAGCEWLAAYVRSTARRLAEQAVETIRQGRLAFPDPPAPVGSR